MADTQRRSLPTLSGRGTGKQGQRFDWRSSSGQLQREGGSKDGRRTTPQQKNVGDGERAVSAAAGAILATLGLGRRDTIGWVIVGVGAALAYRGASGHCSIYQALDIDTANPDGRRSLRSRKAGSGVEVTASYLINKPPDVLYAFWRDFENLPQFMSHLESVRKIDDKQSHWAARAPRLYGGSVEWDAEITADEPNSRIEWRSLPGSDIEHRGAVQFAPALVERWFASS